ncbi:hypothetical protein, partial [Methylorubrum salsuginis]
RARLLTSPHVRLLQSWLILSISPVQSQPVRSSSLRDELSPISSWCHIFDPQSFGLVKETTLYSSISHIATCWSGLAIAEAQLLANRPVEALKLAACLATATFAVARTAALWPQTPLADSVNRYTECNRFVRGAENNSAIISKLKPIWESLNEYAKGTLNPKRQTVRLLKILDSARRQRDDDEAAAIWGGLDNDEIFSFLPSFSNRSPEERVKIFDLLTNAASNSDGSYREILCFMAGYVATVAAGGQSSVGLAESISDELPEVLAWTYIIGGVGVVIPWSSSFVGLGRLVYREINRPFHLDEAPICDFALDEAVCLIDSHLSDPYVHLKIKQQRIVSVAIYPGVNINIPLQDQPEVKTRSSVATETRKENFEMRRVVDDLWPYIKEKIINEGMHFNTRNYQGSGKRKSLQRRLPLDKD